MLKKWQTITQLASQENEKNNKRKHFTQWKLLNICNYWFFRKGFSLSKVFSRNFRIPKRKQKTQFVSIWQMRKKSQENGNIYFISYIHIENHRNLRLNTVSQPLIFGCWHWKVFPRRNKRINYLSWQNVNNFL